MTAVWKPSVTVAAVIERDGKYLLVEERADGRLVFNQPAGHWEQGESLTEGCAREAMEETAYAFTPTHLLGFFTWTHPRSNVTFVRVAFSGEVGECDETRALDKEIVRAVWLTPDEIRALEPQHRSPLVWACIEAHRSGVRYPLSVIGHY